MRRGGDEIRVVSSPGGQRVGGGGLRKTKLGFIGSVGVGEQLMAVGEWVETGDWRLEESGAGGKGQGR
jgi:hypothetical protein